MVAVGRRAAKDRLFLDDDALRGLLIMLNFLGSIFRRDRSVFGQLFVALNILAQILIGDVVSALAFVLHVRSLHA